MIYLIYVVGAVLMAIPVWIAIRWTESPGRVGLPWRKR